MLAASAASARGDREFGEYLSSQCTGCHQISGRASGGVPPIVAWPEEQFIAVIRSYKEGIRENETMRMISHRLSQEEIEALAAYFGSLARQPAIR
jgi:cytochrome c553